MFLAAPSCRRGTKEGYIKSDGVFSTIEAKCTRYTSSGRPTLDRGGMGEGQERSYALNVSEAQRCNILASMRIAIDTELYLSKLPVCQPCGLSGCSAQAQACARVCSGDRHITAAPDPLLYDQTKFSTDAAAVECRMPALSSPGADGQGAGLTLTLTLIPPTGADGQGAGLHRPLPGGECPRPGTSH